MVLCSVARSFLARIELTYAYTNTFFLILQHGIERIGAGHANIVNICSQGGQHTVLIFA